MLEDLKVGVLEYKIAEEFLTDLRKKFGEEEEETVKAAELRRLKQSGKTIKEFVQEFKRIARESRYERRLLIEEFKQKINSII